MSHRARKAAAKKHRHRLWIEPELRVCATAVANPMPIRPVWTFRSGLVLS
jgi:hypothetical protein